MLLQVSIEILKRGASEMRSGHAAKERLVFISMSKLFLYICPEWCLVAATAAATAAVALAPIAHTAPTAIMLNHSHQFEYHKHHALTGLPYPSSSRGIPTMLGDRVRKAALFGNGGKVGITEFSWNPTNMKAFTTRAECQKQGVTCFRQNPGMGSPDYFIPT